MAQASLISSEKGEDKYLSEFRLEGGRRGDCKVACETEAKGHGWGRQEVSGHK